MDTRGVGRTALCVILIAAGCGDPTGPISLDPAGRLEARPHAPTGPLLLPGEHVLDLGLARNPVVYLPPGHDPAVMAPLAVLFHGSGGSAEAWTPFYQHADRLGVVLLMIQSRGGTWDLLVERGWGSDRTAVDRALEAVFDRCAIDDATVAFVGFSDGASYALSLGLNNPSLVRRLAAFSPGFENGARGRPRAPVFIAHGVADSIFPLEATREVVHGLRADGYRVTYREFAGGHEIPVGLGRTAFDWLASADPR